MFSIIPDDRVACINNVHESKSTSCDEVQPIQTRNILQFPRTKTDIHTPYPEPRGFYYVYQKQGVSDQVSISNSTLMITGIRLVQAELIKIRFLFTANVKYTLVTSGFAV